MVGVGGEVGADGIYECSARGCLAGLASLAGPGDRRKVAEVVDGEVLDFGDAHSEEAEPDDDLVAESDEGAVLTVGDEGAVCLVVGEPAAGVLGLDLSVCALVGPERAVVVSEMLCGVVGGDPCAVAPAQECGGFGGPLVDGVVGRAAVGTEVEQVVFGELLGVASSGVAEQPVEGAAVVGGGLVVRVPAAETFDQVEQVANGGAERADLSGAKVAAFP
jgi:hypothetical protein